VAVTKPTSQTVRVWIATLAQADANLRSWLDDEELERLLRYEGSADRARFLLGAVMLRLAVANELGTSPLNVPVHRVCGTCGRRSHGRPIVPNSGLELSVSHSGLVVALALGTGSPVGIDVERVGDYRPEDIRSWTRAEARLKAGGGSGLTIRELAAPVPGYFMSIATGDGANVAVRLAAELLPPAPPPAQRPPAKPRGHVQAHQ
jgi:4'-phosphopantetheinyl transferase